MQVLLKACRTTAVAGVAARGRAVLTILKTPSFDPGGVAVLRG
jgi:hypothetical protein